MLAEAFEGQGMQAWDRARLLQVEALPFRFDAAIWYESFGASSMLIPLVAVAIVISVWVQRPLLAAEFLAGFLLGKPIFLVGWMIWDRTRPDLIADGIAAPSLHSFPSGHAFQTAAVYGLLTYLWLRRSRSVVERTVGTIMWLCLVGVVGLARLRMGTHWPTDVIVGWIVGTAWLVVLIYALRAGEAAGGR
jgi:undecaprenyl-diphosphatase